MTRHEAFERAVPGYSRGNVLSVPGVWDGLSTTLVEQAGFRCAFLSGGALSMARHARPDTGLVTMTELVQALAVIREISDLPLIVDADTGFGNEANTQRTIRALAAAGATAIQLEDQEFPKRCGFVAGKQVIPAYDFVNKLKAALDVRRSERTLIIARTDARAIEGFEAALDRAARYVEAGADLLFVEGPETIGEMMQIGSQFGDSIPLIHNLVEGGNSPVNGADAMKPLGYTVALHPLLMLHGFIRQAPHLLGVLKLTGSTASLAAEIGDLKGFGAILKS